MPRNAYAKQRHEIRTWSFLVRTFSIHSPCESFILPIWYKSNKSRLCRHSDETLKVVTVHMKCRVLHVKCPLLLYNRQKELHKVRFSVTCAYLACPLVSRVFPNGLTAQLLLPLSAFKHALFTSCGNMILYMLHINLVWSPQHTTTQQQKLKTKKNIFWIMPPKIMLGYKFLFLKCFVPFCHYF